MKSIVNLKNIVLFIFVLRASVFAQDPTFSQYFNNKIFLNPAYAGSENGWRVSVNYRNQWPSLQGQFNTANFSADMGIKEVQGGVGLLVLNDKTGKNAYNTNASYLNLQKLVRIKSTANQLLVAYFGAQVGFVQKKYDWNNLVFSDQIDPVLGVIQGTSAVKPENSQKNYADFGAGSVIRYKTNNHYSSFGLAISHLNRPNQSFYGADIRLPMRWTIHYITQLPIHVSASDKVVHTFLSPTVFVQKQGYSEELNVGLKLHQDFMYAGLAYRFKRFNLAGKRVDAAIFHIGMSGAVDNSYHWQVGYSYDATVSGIRTATSGTHEISILIEYDKLKIGKHGMYTKTKHCIDHNSHVKNMPVF